MMEVIIMSETSVGLYQDIQRSISADADLHTRHLESLTAQQVKLFGTVSAQTCCTFSVGISQPLSAPVGTAMPPSGNMQTCGCSFSVRSEVSPAVLPFQPNKAVQKSAK
jgi:hypothetical protein